MKQKHLIRGVILILFATYCTLLLYILFLDARTSHLTYFEHIKRSINLLPFKTIAEYISRISENSINLSSFIKNIFGNSILFIPMGFFLPCISKRIIKMKNIIFINIIIIVGVELIQLFSTLGSFDIDDILLNLIGSIIGYSITKMYPINIVLKKMKLVSE